MITCGLLHLHRNNYIHRDFNPKNIFVKKYGNLDLLIIGDLGIVRPIY